MSKLYPIILSLTAALTLSSCGEDQAPKKDSSAEPHKMTEPQKAVPAKIAKVSPATIQKAFASGPKGDELEKKTREQLMSVAPGKRMKPHAGGNPHANLGPEKIINIALQHLAEKRPDEAMRSLAGGIYKYPENHQMRGIRASLYLRSKSYAKALADLEVALKLKPDDPLLLINRAQAYRGFRRNNDAMADLNKAIELAPKMIGARFNRGALFFEQKKYKQALVDFESCVETDPHAAAPRFNLAMTKDVLGQRKEAITELEQFLKVTKHGGWRAIAEKQLEKWGKPVKKAQATPEAKTTAARGSVSGAKTNSQNAKDAAPKTTARTGQGTVKR